WYLLHFEKRNGYLKDSATVIDILKNKGYLENYGKSVDVFEELQEHQPEAIQYAKERVERLTRDQVAVICRDSNPVTTVYELVEFLNSKRT
ncbi:MAG: RloB domain-containing protein, partial [Anaerobutyricum sp.]